MSHGVQSQITLAKETTYGTAVTPTKSLAVRPTGGVAVKENIVEVPAIKGQLQKNYDTIKGKVAYEGSYTFDAFADYLGYFLLSALGTDTPALHAGETIVYDHVFTETVPKPSLTIEQGIAENCRRYAGSLINQIKISAKTGEMVTVEASVIAKTQASSTQVTGAFTTVPAFNFSQAVVKIGGSTIAEVEDLELTYKNGASMVYALGSTDPSYTQISGGSEVEGKLTMFLDSTTLTRFTNYLAKTSESIELILTNPTTIGVAANYVLDITIPKAVYKTGETKITDTQNMLEVSFVGIYDTVTSALIKCTLTNLIASY